MAKDIRDLKLAIFTKLNSDSELRELLGGEGRILHAQPAQETEYPCVIYSIINDADFPYNENSGESSITQTFFRITIFSKESTTEKADAIESRVKTLLHGQRSLDTDRIICYSCYRENLMEPIRDPDLLAWIIATRYRVTWGAR